MSFESDNTPKIQKYRSFEDLQQARSLIFDPNIGFYRNPAGAINVLRRQTFIAPSPIRTSDGGTLGAGIYVGNSEGSIASFSHAPTMKHLAAIELPMLEDDEIFNVGSSRRLFKAVNKLRSEGAAEQEAYDAIFGSSRFVVIKPSIGNNIGSLIFTGRYPRGALWGLWRDQDSQLVPYGEIDAQST